MKQIRNANKKQNNNTQNDETHTKHNNNKTMMKHTQNNETNSKHNLIESQKAATAIQHINETSTNKK